MGLFGDFMGWQETITRSRGLRLVPLTGAVFGQGALSTAADRGQTLAVRLFKTLLVSPSVKKHMTWDLNFSLIPQGAFWLSVCLLFLIHAKPLQQQPGLLKL